MSRYLAIPLIFCALAGAQVAPDTVVATVGGERKVTAEQLRRIVASLPAPRVQVYNKNPKEYLHQYFLLLALAEMAEKAGLDQRSPYKDWLEDARRQVLAQVQINEATNSVNISQEELQKHYEQNKGNYQTVHVKVIYIPYSLTPPPRTDPKAKKVLTEPEARAKADSLRKQIRAGADFVKLVKEHSEDATSVAKDGDLGPIRPADKMAEEIKKAVLALKAGEVSEPVKQPNGYYLFRAERVEVPAFPQIASQIYEELRQARFNEWFDKVRKSVEVKIENESFFANQ